MAVRSITIRQTEVFATWLRNLNDRSAAVRIATRIIRIQSGLLGDVKPVGEGVSELRVDYGPGYRLYFIQRGSVVIVLLCGGNKKTQRRDIETAKALAKGLEV